MKRLKTITDWVLASTLLFVVLSIMGKIDQEEQEINAQVLAEAAQAANDEAAEHKREMAAIDARARYMTSYDNIKLAEVGQ